MSDKDQPTDLTHAINRGLEYINAGSLSEAEGIFHEILAIKPSYAEVYRHLGVALAGQGKWEAALNSFLKSVEIDPGYVDGHIGVGNAYFALKRYEEALDCYRWALELDPGSAKADSNLGLTLNVLCQAGRLAEAETIVRRLVAMRPDRAETHRHLGVALAGQGKWEAALNSFLKSVEIDPGYVDGHIGVGNVYFGLKLFKEAFDCYQKALQLNPDSAKAHSNLGLTLHVLGKLDEAVASYHRALTLHPNFADAFSNLGNVLQDLGRHDEAMACYNKALQTQPASSSAPYNISTLLLLRGDLDHGFALYERRFAGGDRNLMASLQHQLARVSGKPRWQGDALHGSRLLVWGEQGYGDIIMMLRYLPLLKNKGAGEIIVSCRPELFRLVKTIHAVDQVVDLHDHLPLEGIDCHCPIMSLPYLLGTRLDTIPKAVPYIAVPPAIGEKWLQRLTEVEGLKVGLAWRGSKTQERDSLRSIPLDRLAPLLAVPGARFVNLTKDEPRLPGDMLNWMAECEDFLETAALVQQLDLIISVDTAVAHLAGALARPVWLLNRYGSEWRWLLGREDSPWYPTMRIFRQPASQDWDSVIRRVAVELERL